MADAEHQLAQPEAPEFSLRGKRIRNPKLRRGIFLLPSLFTVGNLLCGYYACVAVATSLGPDHSGDPFDRAAKAIGLAMVFDALDGRVARLTGTNTEFGVQFDSLADVVTFGIAPSLLAVTWGVRNLAGLDASQGAQQIAHLGWWFCLAFAVCCAWRLARFNVQGMASGGSKYFVGMPTPAAAGMIAATVHAFKEPIQDWRWSIAWIVLVLTLAGLMTSTIRLQLQRPSMDAQAAVARNCDDRATWRCHVALVRGSFASSRRNVYCSRRNPAHCPFAAASPRLSSNCVIHVA